VAHIVTTGFSDGPHFGGCVGPRDGVDAARKERGLLPPPEIDQQAPLSHID